MFAVFNVSSSAPPSAPTLSAALLCSHHGWCGHIAAESTTLHPVLTKVRKQEIPSNMNAKSTAEDKERWSKVRCGNCGKLGDTVALCPQNENPEAQAASKQAHTKRKEQWAQKNDFASTASTILSVSVNSSASAAVRQAPLPSAAFTYETTEKPRPVGPHADITGWTRSPTNAKPTYLHTIAPCIMTVTAVDKGARFLFSTSEAMSAAKAVLENMRHDGTRGSTSYYNEGTSVTTSTPTAKLPAPSPAVPTTSDTPRKKSIEETNKQVEKVSGRLDNQDSKLDQTLAQLISKPNQQSNNRKRKPAEEASREAEGTMDEDEEDLLEEYTGTDMIDDALSPPEKAVPTNCVEKPQIDVVYYVVTGNRGHWSMAPAKMTKTKKKDMGRCNLYFTRYTQNADTGWTAHNLIYQAEENAARIAADLYKAFTKHGHGRP